MYENYSQIVGVRGSVCSVHCVCVCARTCIERENEAKCLQMVNLVKEYTSSYNYSYSFSLSFKMVFKLRNKITGNKIFRKTKNVALGQKCQNVPEADLKYCPSS